MFEPDEFEWDDRKSLRNEAKHGLGFEYALQIFRDPRLAIMDTTRATDGELRAKAIGFAYDRLFTVVFTWREDRRRIISFRRSNRREERFYGNHQNEA